MPGFSGRKVHLFCPSSYLNQDTQYSSEATWTDILPSQRSYAQITRSASPTESPPPRSKRRRLSSTAASIQSNSRFETSPVSNVTPPRFAGDGLDYRRPVMSAEEQRPQPPVIDLTAIDESPPLDSRQPSPYSSLFTSPSPDVIRRPVQRAPPFPNNRSNPEVIVLDSDIQEEERPPSPPQHLAPLDRQDSSSDLEFLGERVIHNEIPVPHANRRLPTPPTMRQRIGLGGFMRRTREVMANFGGNIGPAIHRPDRPPLNQLPQAVAALRDIGEALHGYDNVNMNYDRPAFALNEHLFGAERREIDRSSTPPEVVDPEPYKTPAPADKGYSRNLTEADVVVCPCCGKELGLGNDDQEQQIWVAKSCGHVYCGECASNRLSTKDGNNKHRRTAKQRKFANPMKVCLAEGCKAKLHTKSAMVQIYL